MKTFTKDPEAVLDYEWDWSAWLGTDIIAQVDGVVFTATEGLVVDSFTSVDGVIVAWISGGTDQESGIVTCKITTALGRVNKRSAIFNLAPQ